MRRLFISAVCELRISARVRPKSTAKAVMLDLYQNLVKMRTCCFRIPAKHEVVQRLMSDHNANPKLEGTDYFASATCGRIYQ